VGEPLEKMKKQFLTILLCCVLIICACSIFSPDAAETKPTLMATVTPAPTNAITVNTDGFLAVQYLTDLSKFGSRSLQKPGHHEAATYIEDTLIEMGYKPVLQKFVTEKGKKAANIFVDKSGKSDRWILACSHFDSVGVGSGVDDNGSGVAVLLEMAQRVKDIDTPYSIRFIFLDAEETGLEGSEYYVSQMSEKDVRNTAAMINLDSLAVGDFTYIYGNEGDAGVIRDWALKYAGENGLDLITQPGKNPEYPAGTTLDASDHAPFLYKGIQYAYFEATNWDLGDLDGYVQVDTSLGEEGEIWHTEFDTLKYITDTFPGRMESHLKLFSNVLFHILTEYKE
jgi:Zn-dependent M28 family amino/carboxypeptidase